MTQAKVIRKRRLRCAERGMSDISYLLLRLKNRRMKVSAKADSAMKKSTEKSTEKCGHERAERPRHHTR
jgi:hypothetical protein